MGRKILHCDMNNFYASVECMLNPSLRNLPIAVCGDTEERHGIVLAKNYQAKGFGIKTGDTVWQAKNKCRTLLVVSPHYDEYIKYSRLARNIYLDYTDDVEGYGMDECWLDVTSSERLFGPAEKIAFTIKERIKFELGLTISVGVSFNKVFAKLGSDMKKPDAITVIPEDCFKDIIFDLPASDMLGVGYSTDKILKSYCIETIGQLAGADPGFLKMKLGKCGVMLWKFANGLDNSPVCKSNYCYPIKSIGHGLTGKSDLASDFDVWQTLLSLAGDVGRKLRKYNKDACGVVIDIRDTDLITRQWQTVTDVPTQSSYILAKTAFSLFCSKYEWNKDIRSITIRAIKLTDHNTPYQLSLFHNVITEEKIEKIDRCVDKLEERFGKNIVRSGTLLLPLKFPDEHSELTMPTGMVKQ